MDRQCGSGLAAILIAAQAVRSGDMEFVIAGGAPRARRPRRCGRFGTGPRTSVLLLPRKGTRIRTWGGSGGGPRRGARREP
ncbi:beta-ketoacyl synthase N-terminal-like domain-containing protein [Nonomuraea ferruginea]